MLTVYYRDQTKNEDTFLFVPALRRTLRLSSAARCSPVFGSDPTNDDTRHGAFNGKITKFDATWLGDGRVIAQPDPDVLKSGDMSQFLPPLYFPKPDLGKWEMRDVDIIDARHIPSLRAGYCYGKRILYCDKDSHNAKWAELYDENMKLWKIFNDPQGLVKTSEGNYWTNAAWGNIANSDCTNVSGFNLSDSGRCGSVRGLSEIPH